MTFLTVKQQGSNFSITTPDNYEDPLRSQNVGWTTNYYGVRFPYIVPNFAFNQPEIASGTFKYSPTAAWVPAGSGSALGWIFGTGAGISSATGSPFTGANPAPPDGIAEVAFIQNQGTITQTFTSKSLSANHQYTLGFWEAARNYGGYDGNAVVVSMDGKRIGSFIPTSTSYAPMYFNFTTNGSSNHTLTFSGLNTQGDKTTFIASVSIG